MKMIQAQKDNKCQGASLVEYTLLVAMIALVALMAIRVFGSTVSAQYSSINEAVTQ